jgi:hypothetical protein
MDMRAQLVTQMPLAGCHRHKLPVAVQALRVERDSQELLHVSLSREHRCVLQEQDGNDEHGDMHVEAAEVPTGALLAAQVAGQPAVTW